MKDMKILLVFFNVLFILPLVKSANVTQTYLQERNYGTWGALIQAQNINTAPASYFICKVGLRESRWEKLMWNCNCRLRWTVLSKEARYGCQWCSNYFMNMVDAIKVTYCHNLDWQKQIQKTFQTGKQPTGTFRDISCPQNTYVNRVALRFGQQQGVDIGLVGIQMKCSSLDLKKYSFVQDNYEFPLSSPSQNTQHLFASSLFVKHEEGGKLTGLKIGFESVLQIYQVNIKYADLKLVQPTQTVFQQIAILNNGTTALQKTISLNKSFITINRLQTNSTQIQGFRLSQLTITSFFPFIDKDGKPSPDSNYKVTLKNFLFNKNIQTIFKPVEQVFVMVAPKKEMRVKSIITDQNVTLPFEANLTFVDQYNKKSINTKYIKGVWKGVLTYPPETLITQKAIVQNKQMTTSTNLVRKNPPVLNA